MVVNFLRSAIFFFFLVSFSWIVVVNVSPFFNIQYIFSFVCFFNRDFVGGWLDVVSMKRFQFVETDKELCFLFFFLFCFVPPKWSFWNPLMSP